MDPVILHRLANSVEVLGNIFYLLELHTDSPEKIEHFIEIGKPALAALQDFIRREFNPIRLNQ